MSITVVLLPGLNGTDGLFKQLVDRAPKDCSVIAMSYPVHKKQDYAQLAELVKNKLTELDSPFILVGESFSGPLALMLSKHNLQGLLGIVLVATFVTAPNLRVGRFLPWQLGFRLARPLYALRLRLSASENRSFIKSISTELQKVSPGVLADRIQHIFNVNVIQELHDCSVPVTYFRGTKDFVVPLWNLKQIQKHKPSVRVVKFNTQHFLLQSKPDQAWREIGLFINSLEPRTRLQDPTTAG